MVGLITDRRALSALLCRPMRGLAASSRRLVEAMEALAVERGNLRCHRRHTETARRFYLSAGCVEDGPPQRQFGTSQAMAVVEATAGGDLSGSISILRIADMPREDWLRSSYTPENSTPITSTT